MLESRGGTGSREPPGKQLVLQKKAIGPHHLGKGWTSWHFRLWKNCSFFEINIGPPLQNKLRTKKLSGLFSTGWAQTAHHPGENSWIHACTHVVYVHAFCLLYVLYLVIIGHLMLWSIWKWLGGGRPWEQGYCSKGNKGTFVHTCISCILTHVRKIRVDEHITLMLQFAEKTCINVSLKRDQRNIQYLWRIINLYWEDQLWCPHREYLFHCLLYPENRTKCHFPRSQNHCGGGGGSVIQCPFPKFQNHWEGPR